MFLHCGQWLANSSPHEIPLHLGLIKDHLLYSTISAQKNDNFMKILYHKKAIIQTDMKFIKQTCPIRNFARTSLNTSQSGMVPTMLL